MAATTRPSPTAPTRSTASTSTIVPGGPQANNRMLLPVGKIDFYMGGNMIQAFSAVAGGHPDPGRRRHLPEGPADPDVPSGRGPRQVRGPQESHNVLIGKEGLATFYQWMKAEFGFTDEQMKPYNFNPAPFIADKKAVQQGYVTSEPLAVEKAGGFKPNVFLLADHGFDTYSTTIETRTRDGREAARRRAEFRRCLDHRLDTTISTATTRPRTTLIKKDNPEMTDEQIAYSIAKMKEYGIVDSGDAATLGIGAMTDERMKSLLRQDGEGRACSRRPRLQEEPTRCNS